MIAYYVALFLIFVGILVVLIVISVGVYNKTANVHFPSWLKPQVCVSYRYDVPYACGLYDNSSSFEDFTQGTYASTLQVFNSYSSAILYSGTITHSVPTPVNTSTTIVNATLSALTTEQVYTCDSPESTFGLAATFYAGTFSIASTVPLSVWHTQTVVGNTSDAPAIQTVKAQEICLLYVDITDASSTLG